MENPLPERQKSKKGWFNRLDSAAAQVNPVLLVLAIGLVGMATDLLFKQANRKLFAWSYL